MSVLDREHPVVINVGECRCSGLPHPDGDTVSLSKNPPLEVGLAASQAMAEDGADNIRIALGLAYLRAIEAWTFLDDDGDPIPVTPENIRLALPWDKGGSIVAEKADDLYTEAVLSPLLRRLSNTSPAGPMAGSTSANRESRRHPPRSSKSSSPEPSGITAPSAATSA